MITITVSIYWFYALVLAIIANAVFHALHYAIKRKRYKLEAERIRKYTSAYWPDVKL